MTIRKKKFYYITLWAIILIVGVVSVFWWNHITYPMSCDEIGLLKEYSLKLIMILWVVILVLFYLVFSIEYEESKKREKVE